MWVEQRGRDLYVSLECSMKASLDKGGCCGYPHAYQRFYTKYLLSQISQIQRHGSYLPPAAIGHTFASQCAADDLMTKAYPCASVIDFGRVRLPKSHSPISLTCGFDSAICLMYAMSLLTHSTFSYAEAAGARHL